MEKSKVLSFPDKGRSRRINKNTVRSNIFELFYDEYTDLDQLHGKTSDARAFIESIIDLAESVHIIKDFTVGIYCSDTPNMNGLEGELTHMNIVMDIARSMPDIKFKLFGTMRKEKVYDNVEMCGKINPEDMNDFINSCSMNLRFTRHDGFPQLPIQFLLCGRKALVSCPDESMMFAEKIGFEEMAIQWLKA